MSKKLKSSPQKLAYMREYGRANGARKKSYSREYYKKNREMFLEAQLKLAYGITRADWNALHEKQGGRCALCSGLGHTGGRSAKLYVDHCHDTGRVRGLVCHRCNLGLGALGDNEAGLTRALAYVRGANG
jgi:hypothetical protein